MLSFLKTYLGVSGEVTTVWIHVVVPEGRKATTYPNPSPFCSSSGTGWDTTTRICDATGDAGQEQSASRLMDMALHLASSPRPINSGAAQQNGLTSTYLRLAFQEENNFWVEFFVFTKYSASRHSSVNTTFLPSIHSS